MDIFFWFQLILFLSLLFFTALWGKDTFRDQSWFLHLVVLFKYFTE